MPQRGRPLGEVSRTVLRALAEQPRSIPQLTVDLVASRRLIASTVYELKSTGRVVAVGTVPGPKRRAVEVLAVSEQPAEDRRDWPSWMR